MSPEPANKTMSYSIGSVQLGTLLNQSQADSWTIEKLDLLHYWASMHEHCDGSFTFLGTKLYFLGGHNGKGDSPYIHHCPTKLSRNFFSFNLTKLKNGSPCLSVCTPLTSMQSGKSKPIAVEIGGKLYVLAGPPYGGGIPDPCFEVYDPSSDRWSTLARPPVLDESSKYFHCRSSECPSYVVIDNKLCLSSYNASFSYDIVEDQWEACKLFDGFGCTSFSARFGSWKNVRAISEKIEGGRPFPFRGQAIVYNGDILICAAYCPFLAIAYKMHNGKVVSEQLLLPEIEIESPFKSFVHLGGGYFCCIYAIYGKDETHCAIVTFEVSKLDGVAKDDVNAEFLRARLVTRCRLKLWCKRGILVHSFPA